jgi:hypothetical protein
MSRTWRINVASDNKTHGFTTTVDAPNISVAREMAANLYPGRFISPPVEVVTPRAEKEYVPHSQRYPKQPEPAYTNNNQQVPLVYQVNSSSDDEPIPYNEPVTEEDLAGAAGALGIFLIGAMLYLYFGGIAGGVAGYFIGHRFLKKKRITYDKGPAQLALCAFLPIIAALSGAFIGQSIQNVVAVQYRHFNSWQQSRPCAPGHWGCQPIVKNK